MSEVTIEELSINTIRTLSMDAVQAANSGHPGTPMAMAPVGIASGKTTCASIPTIPSGRIAIVSSSRSVTLRCSSIHCST